MRQTPTFANHIFDALGVPPAVFDDRIGGAVRVIEKDPEGGPTTLLTLGVSHLRTDSGERVELAVEVAEGQVGAGWIALEIVCDDIAGNRRVPPFGRPWRNDAPFLSGTQISAIVATGSRWGSSFDEVLNDQGELEGHVRTLRLLTDAEAAFVAQHGWDALVEQVGSADALLDVTRSSLVEAPPLPDTTPVFVTKLHAEHPPRWITFTGSEFESIVGLESNEYMDNSDNLEVWSLGSFLNRFGFTEDFIRQARAGQTALFADQSGSWVLEED